MRISTGNVRRLLWWLVASVVVAALLFVALRPRAVAVDVASVERRPLQETVDHEGRTRVHDRYTVSAPVAGRVTRIELRPGDPVVAGKTVVAMFAPAPPPLIDTRTRAGASAGVRAAEAAVTQARARLAQSEAEQAQAEADEARAARLFDGGAMPRVTRDKAATAAQAAVDETRAARAAVTVAEHQLDVARAALAQAGAESPPALAIHAPVTGVVLRRFHESEAVVGAGEPLVEIADPSDLEIVADYLSSDAVRIQQGMPVLVDRWGGSDVIRGRVTRVEPFGFVKVSALGVEEQRVNVLVGLQDATSGWGRLGDGYRVEVRVVLWEGADVLTVPTSALFRRGDDWAVFAVDADDRARMRVVRIGHQTGVWTEVLDGVHEHDRVVTHPPDAVADGVRVAAREGEVD